MPGHIIIPLSISCHVSDFNLQAASSVQLESSNSRQFELPCTQTVQVLRSIVHAEINSHHTWEYSLCVFISQLYNMEGL